MLTLPVVAEQCRVRGVYVKAVLLAVGEHDAIGPTPHAGVGPGAAW